MKILITGINGFIGAALSKKLFMQNHEVYGITRDKRSLPLEILEKFTIIQGDLLKGVKIPEVDVIIHCAARTNEKIMSTLLNKTNVDATRKLFSQLNKDTHIIFLSCDTIYNLNEEAHTEIETIKKALLDSQGRSKFDAEQMLKADFTDRDITILRPSMTYGIGDSRWLSKILELRKNGKIHAPGNLNCQKSMCCIENLVDTILHFIENPTKGIQTYNVADYKIYPWEEIISSILTRAYDEKFMYESKSEVFARIKAGLATVLRPGSNLTQSRIDFFTQSHILDTTKLQRLDVKFDYHFENYFDKYFEWISNTGVKKIKKNHYTIPWI